MVSRGSICRYRGNAWRSFWMTLSAPPMVKLVMTADFALSAGAEAFDDLVVQ